MHAVVHILSRDGVVSANRQVGCIGTSLLSKVISVIDLSSTRRSSHWCSINPNLLLLLILVLVLTLSSETQSNERYRLCQWYAIMLLYCMYRD
jgi:hypothetical protein